VPAACVVSVPSPKNVSSGGVSVRSPPVDSVGSSPAAVASYPVTVVSPVAVVSSAAVVASPAGSGSAVSAGWARAAFDTAAAVASATRPIQNLFIGRTSSGSPGFPSSNEYRRLSRAPAAPQGRAQTKTPR